MIRGLNYFFFSFGFVFPPFISPDYVGISLSLSLPPFFFFFIHRRISKSQRLVKEPPFFLSHNVSLPPFPLRLEGRGFFLFFFSGERELEVPPFLAGPFFSPFFAVPFSFPPPPQTTPCRIAKIRFPAQPYHPFSLSLLVLFCEDPPFFPPSLSPFVPPRHGTLT